jgi:YfiH family protein
MGDELLHWDGLGTPHAFETRHGDLRSELPLRVLRLRQVHGGEVHVIRPETVLDAYAAGAPEDRPAGDALVTATRGITVAVATADCVPVLVHDPVAEAVGAAHAGWRGVAAGVVAETLLVMVNEFGTVPANCRAAIGPCVGASAYRVGQDVRDAFRAGGLPEDLFRSPENDAEGSPTTWLCDLGRAVVCQLRDAGLTDGSIWLASRCTVSEQDAFHSYRRDGTAAGRMTSGIALA